MTPVVGDCMTLIVVVYMTSLVEDHMTLMVEVYVAWSVVVCMA